jgi:DnaJ family protein C protein 2
LIHHPDKQIKTDPSSDPEAEVFKLIQKAYETLSDPKKRRAYDSQEPFDDSIPSSESVHNPSDFYAIFGPVFERNARWSVNPDVPTLGDENTPYEDVLKFYSFWYNFKSWRDFSYLDEYDPSEAETREEKRWMERRNARLQAKRKREEMQRITKLVDTAYKLDPRIKKYREEQQARKEQMKRERQEALRKKKGRGREKTRRRTKKERRRRKKETRRGHCKEKRKRKVEKSDQKTSTTNSTILCRSQIFFR